MLVDSTGNGLAKQRFSSWTMLMIACPFLHGWRRGGAPDSERSAIHLIRLPLQRNRLVTRENRDVPIIDFMDDGYLTLLRNESRVYTGEHGTRMNILQ